MLRALPDFLATYWMYVVGLCILAGALAYFSEKVGNGLKKGLKWLGVAFALILLYELATGNDVLDIPRGVWTKLHKDVRKEQTNPRYYKDTQNRLGIER